MSDCFEVLARSAIVSTKREECDQLGQGHALPLHNVKLEWSSEMNCPGDARYELSPFQSSFTGYSLDDRSGLNSHLQHYCSKQLSQGGAFMSASGVNSELLGVSTDSSTVLNTWSGDGGGCVSQKARNNQMRPVEEQWWVDFISPGSIVVPSTLSQLENNAVSATVEFGVRKQQIEDFERMLLTQAADPTNMKWFSGDGQTYGQGDIQPVLNLGVGDMRRIPGRSVRMEMEGATMLLRLRSGDVEKEEVL